MLIFSLASCSSLEPISDNAQQTLSKLPLRSQLAYTNPHSLGFPTFSQQNYREVLSKQLSGVYQHPFYQGEIVTFVFDLEFSASSELERLGLHRDFEKQRRLIQSSYNAGSTASAIHVLLAYRNQIDSNVIAVHPKLLRPQTPLQVHRYYFLLMHEIAHSLHSQTDALLAKRSITELENFSDIVATILLYQLMIGEREPLESFFATLHLERFASDTTLISHRTNHVFILLADLIKQNQERFLYMTPPEIEIFASQLAFALANHDYGEPQGVQDITSHCYLKWKGNADYFIRVASPTLDKFKLKYTMNTAKSLDRLS